MTTSTMITLASACAPTGFSATPGSPASKQVAEATPTPVPLVCVPDTADYMWDVNIFGFSLSGTNFNVGYSGPVIGPINSVDVGVKIDKGTLNLQMWTQKPYDLGHSVGADYTETNGFDFKVDLGIIRFGVGSNQDGQGALIKLTKNSFSKLVSNASADLAKDPNPWSTHIVQQLDANRFKIPVGALAGLKYGDKFNVYKYEYSFATAGDCSSVNGGAKVSTKVIATLIPLDIKDGSATMTLVGTPTQALSVNDIVEIQELYKAKKSDKRALKKAVRITALRQPNHISIAGSADIDLTSYLNYQIPTLMNSDANYWLLP